MTHNLVIFSALITPPGLLDDGHSTPHFEKVRPEKWRQKQDFKAEQIRTTLKEMEHVGLLIKHRYASYTASKHKTKVCVEPLKLLHAQNEK